MNRPVVCFLTGTMNAFAGAERMTAVLANALAERGYTVHIGSLFDAKSCFALDEGVAHASLFATRPSFKRQYLTTIRRIRRYVAMHKIDILIEVDPMLTWFTLPALAGTGVRRIAWEHCHFNEDLGKPARRVARRLAARSASAVVVLTPADRDVWASALRHRFDLRVIANPLPFPWPDEPAARTSRTVLAVGRLVPAKGFDVLLEAWPAVMAHAPEWRLKIVGEGPERRALEAKVATLGIGAGVSLPGTRADIEAAYRDASIFCLSSRYEGFGLVLLEAMACGLPVVSTACEAGPRSLLRDGVNAVTVDVDSPEALAQGLLKLIGNVALQQALAAAGRSTALDYAVDRIVDQWETLFSDVCGEVLRSQGTSANESGAPSE